MPSAFRTIRPALVAVPVVAMLAVATIFMAAPHARGEGGGPSGAETIGVTIPPAGAVTCTRDGKKLPSKPTVHRHDRLHCTATGFKPNEQVEIAVHSPATVIATVPADSHGVDTYDYMVPNDLAAGEHSLSFTGKASTTVAIYPFVVVVGHGTSGTGGGGGSHGGLAFTGTDLLALVLAALGLIGMGVALHRRRLQREAA
jgi:hypothetical protein